MADSCGEQEKITVLHIASGDLWAGAETMLWYLAREQQASSSVAPNVLLLNEGQLAKRLREIGVPVTIVPESTRRSGPLLSAIKQTVKWIAPDIVHTHRKKENVLGAVAAKGAAVPSIRTVHGVDEHPAKIYQFKKKAAEVLDAISSRWWQRRTIAVSEALLQTLKERGTVRLEVVHNGIDAAYVEGRSKRSAIRPRESNGSVTIGFVGRLTPVKRVDRFLRIARELHQRRRDGFRFLLVGDGPLLESTKQMIRSLGLSEAVTLTGHIEDCHTTLASLDALFITSDSEGIPYVALECLAIGIPVVASNVGGMPEVLDNGRAGVLVEPEDTAAFVAHGLRLAEEHRAFDDLVQRGRDLVRTEFSSRRMMFRYDAVYGEVCRLSVEHP